MSEVNLDPGFEHALTPKLPVGRRTFRFWPFINFQAHLLDGAENRSRRRGLHPAETGLPPRQDYHSQVAAAGGDGPAGQGAVGPHQEAGDRPAGREGQKEPGQRGTLRKLTPGIKAESRNTGSMYLLLTLLCNAFFKTVYTLNPVIICVVVHWEVFSARTEASCTGFISSAFWTK